MHLQAACRPNSLLQCTELLLPLMVLGFGVLVLVWRDPFAGGGIIALALVMHRLQHSRAVALEEAGRMARQLSANAARHRFMAEDLQAHMLRQHDLERERAGQARHVERLSRRLVAVQEEERRRLAANLHDWTSPNLATLKLVLGDVAAAATQQPERVCEVVEDAYALLDDTTAGLREICSDLRPPVLDFAGLVPALDSYAAQFRRRTGIAVRVHGAPGPLGAEVETALFRITQEALANCAKHAGASSIDLTLERLPQAVRLTIADDGAGFHVAAGLEGGFGLITMRERAEFVGGRLDIESAPGAGVTIVAAIPVPQPAEAYGEVSVGLQSPQLQGG